MIPLNATCACGGTEVEVKLTADPAEMAPRACDCDFCRARDLAWVSDPDGRLLVRSARPLARQRQGSGQAEFLSCGGCGRVVAVRFADGEGAWAAVNARLFGPVFAAAASASPRQLSPEDKARRWREVWFRDLAGEVR